MGSETRERQERGEEQPRLPVVLFDGVCNLCNGAVQWLIERDPEARLAFASLQSLAARRVLTGAGVDDPSTLPDSMVLVDEHGAHVRSTAALRIAGRLGFPYNLARVGLLVPRPLRDAVYALIARHRYRWFGRRDTCVRPTPELARRFLDADEPAPEVEVSSEPDAALDEPSRAGRWLQAALGRFAVVYVVVYLLPFPLTLLPLLAQLPLLREIPRLGSILGWPAGLYSGTMNPLVSWVGDAVFGVEAALQFTGSGDRTFNYVQLAVTASLSLLLAVVWTLMSRGRAIGPRVLDASRVLARYYLATTLMGYGWAKALPLQFPLPGPDRLLQPYGDSSPMGLAWTFLGASQAYQVFSGLAELLCAYLLLFRRTALPGALVGIVVLTNVVAINLFYDVPVKLFSAHLLLIAVFIAAKDFPRLLAAIGSNLPIARREDRPFWRVTRRRSLAIGVGKAVLVAGLTLLQVQSNLQRARTSGYLRAASPVAGVYRVESFERAGVVGRENEDDARWVKVGISPPYAITVQRATGDATRMRLALDEEAGTLSLFDRGAQPPEEPQFRYREVEPGLIELEGSLDGAEMRVLLRRSEEGSLLMDRGYRWINEYPFNR